MPHIHKKIDFVATVYIVNDGAVFLHFHKKLGTWLAAGGHIELDEDPNEAAVREAKEETGLAVELIGEKLGFKEREGHTELFSPRFMNRYTHPSAGEHEHIDLVYFGISKSRDVKIEPPTDYKWFTKEDLENTEIELLPTIRYYAKAALEAATK